MRYSRRTVLASLGTAALGGLAGCNSLPVLGDGEDSSPRSWLYDPTEYMAATVAGLLHVESPAELVGLEDHLHPDALADRPAALYAHDLDRESVEWTMLYGDNLFRTPHLRAYGGSFNAEAAKESTATGFETDPEAGVERDDADGFGLVEYGDNQFGLSRGGEAACIDRVESEETVREIVRQRDDSSPGLADTSDELGRLLETVRLDTSASISFQLDEDDEQARGHGYGYTADGETTTVRYAVLHGDRPLDDLEALEDIIDALTDVTVDEDDGIRRLEGTVDTGKLAFDGSLFDLLEAPYE